MGSKARRVFEIPDDASILAMQLRREIELNQHDAETSDIARGTRAPPKDRQGGIPRLDQVEEAVETRPAFRRQNTRKDFEALSPSDRMAKMKDGLMSATD